MEEACPLLSGGQHASKLRASKTSPPRPDSGPHAGMTLSIRIAASHAAILRRAIHRRKSCRINRIPRIHSTIWRPWRPASFSCRR
jgi:hypothetical protein